MSNSTQPGSPSQESPKLPVAGQLDDAAHSLVAPAYVATWLGISKSAVYRLAAQADGIPAVEVGPRCLRFRSSDVRAYIERRTRRLTMTSRAAALLGGPS